MGAIQIAGIAGALRSPRGRLDIKLVLEAVETGVPQAAGDPSFQADGGAQFRRRDLHIGVAANKDAAYAFALAESLLSAARSWAAPRLRPNDRARPTHPTLT